MELLKPFYEAANDPYAYASQWKDKNGGKVVGTLCSYAPEEIIQAAGALPMRIFGSGAGISRADAHLQAYGCSLIRGALEDLLAGRLDFLDGTVFPHTCDSIQRLSDIWRMHMGKGFHTDVVLPVKLDTESAGAYMIQVMARFRKDMEKALNVEISDEMIRVAAETYNRIRFYLGRLYEIRRENPGVVGSSDIHAVVRASMVMDRSRLGDLLAGLVQAFEEKQTPLESDRKRILLCGGLCNMPDIFDAIENSNGRVVWDDLCSGSRYFSGKIHDEPDMIAALSERYRNRVVCPAKHSGIYTRGEHIIRTAKTVSADGVIFVFLKFCDPHLFDYPYIKKMLEAENIPSLLFEVEEGALSQGQFRTRCEAFIEML
jgi:benzoyl-CoA reductase subunit C